MLKKLFTKNIFELRLNLKYIHIIIKCILLLCSACFIGTEAQSYHYSNRNYPTAIGCIVDTFEKKYIKIKINDYTEYACI